MKQYILKFAALRWLALILITAILMLSSAPVIAQAQGAHYGVAPIYPDNQRPDRGGHFNLNMNPGERQRIDVLIENFGTDTIHLDVTVNDARTNDHGVMEYAPAKMPVPGHAPHVSEIVASHQSRLSIAPGDKEFARFEILMPDDAFEGVIVGGLHFVQAVQANAETGGTGIVNRIAYAVPIVLRIHDEVADPAFELIAARGHSHEPAKISVTLKNLEARISRLRNVTAYLYSDDDEPIEVLSHDQVLLAPHAAPNLSFARTSDQPIPKGEYRLVINFECDEWPYLLESPIRI